MEHGIYFDGPGRWVIVCNGRTLPFTRLTESGAFAELAAQTQRDRTRDKRLPEGPCMCQRRGAKL
jgi:hypothetical protein